MTDPIADMLIRIKNAQAVNKETVSLAFSKMKQEIACVLKNHGFILDYEKKGRSVVKKVEIKLKYFDALPAIENVKKISKSSARVYCSYKEIFPKKRILTIISTSKGIMSDKEARKAKLGGEVLCEIS
jgi:small subunit ribosomal protein S8